MWPSQSFNEPIAGYYSNSLDYQNNLINNGNSNFYSNNSSVLKQSPPVMNNSVLSPVSEDETNFKKKRKGQRNHRKVIIEKRRRDRINCSLDELRKLVPAANEKQGSAKLEKAEILQMTVDHLKGLSAKGFDTFSFDPNKFALEHFTIGFKECANEVARHLSSVEGFAFDDPLKLRLISHLQRYFSQREYNLKTCSGLQSVWNPNVFLLPQTSSQTTLTSTSSLINPTTTLSDSQLINSNINTNSVSPITTLPSNLSSHSNSSIGSSNNSNSYQQLNQSNESNASSSPICNSPVTNNNIISANQLLNQHSCTDNNNNTSTSASNNFSNTITNSNVNTQSESTITNIISASMNGDQRSLLSGMMPPPPPPPPTLLQKVTILNNVSPHSPNNSELTYTNMNSTSNAYVPHHHHVSSTFPHLKMDSSQITPNGYATPNYVAVAAAAAASQNHSNHAHHSQYFNTALAYGTSIGQTMSTSMSGTTVPISNSSITSANNNSQHTASTKYCRPWGAEMAY